MVRLAPLRSIRALGLWSGAVAALALIAGPLWGYQLDPARPQLNAMAGVLVLMACWWISEALPIFVTSLVPLVLYPLLRIPPGGQATKEYAHPLIFLFLGGFLIALAIEESGLHRRVALGIIVAMGDRPGRIVLGFMLATALLSMWLSNGATTLMLLPIALSVLKHADEHSPDRERMRRFSVALMLGLAYSASIGGMATLIGTPPNVYFKGFYDERYPNLSPVSFAGWMAMALPLCVVFLLGAWLLLVGPLFRLGREPLLGGAQIVRTQLRALGPVQPAERRMLGLFLLAVVLWVTREPIKGYGWAPWLAARVPAADGSAVPGADDATVAIFVGVLCFVVPSGRGDGTRLLSWQATARLPWGILLLFGGGLALAAGMKQTGLDTFLGARLAAGIGQLSTHGRLMATAGGTTVFTEITSNTASLNMLLPVLAATCDQLGIHPRALMTAATLSASCAFMLPVATAPNAIVYGSGHVRMADMVKAGVWLNVVGWLLIVAWLVLLSQATTMFVG